MMRPSGGRGPGAGRCVFPQVRLVVLAECGTHAVLPSPRGVKRGLSSWGLLKHRQWPRPSALPAEAVIIGPASKTTPTRRKPKART